MQKILENFLQTSTDIKQFVLLLGNDLKAITGDSDQIDLVYKKVFDCVQKLEQFPNDVFNEEYSDNWNMLFEEFKANVNQIDDETCSLINSTFKEKLNSAEGAFELLAKFKNKETRPRIEALMKDKYEDILERYSVEVAEMDSLFEKNRETPPISKNMPPTAGKIAWARSIMGRVKAPIDKFKTKEGLIQSDTGKGVTLKYIHLVSRLDQQYEGKIFEIWNAENTDKAISLLKDNKILTSEYDGEKMTYKVNFSPQLKVIIREAKFLDRIGKKIPQTIINIALQEKEYLRSVDKLNQLIREYNKALSGLKPVEKKLLEKQISRLNTMMNKGKENHNWFSLSI